MNAPRQSTISELLKISIITLGRWYLVPALEITLLSRPQLNRNLVLQKERYH